VGASGGQPPDSTRTDFTEMDKNLCNRDIILLMTNKNNKEKDPRTHAIIGAAMEVHREMGPGFLEAVYHECLEIEFQIRKIPYISKPRLKLYYKTRQLERYYEPDFLVYSSIVVEIKAEKYLTKRCCP
jgi:GxxExxY protein